MSARKRPIFLSLLRNRQRQSLVVILSGAFEVFENKESRFVLFADFLKNLQKLHRDNCFKNENNAVFGVFLQTLNTNVEYQL